MKEFKVTIPEGMEIDRENSTFECIKFKPKSKRWRNSINNQIAGYYIDTDSSIAYHEGGNHNNNYNVFATEKQAKSALAMARITQIMANDERFGGVVTDEEWSDEDIPKHVITRINKSFRSEWHISHYRFLAFHTKEQCDLFLEENEDLVKDYLMID